MDRDNIISNQKMTNNLTWMRWKIWCGHYNRWTFRTSPLKKNNKKCATIQGILVATWQKYDQKIINPEQRRFCKKDLDWTVIKLNFDCWMDIVNIVRHQTLQYRTLQILLCNKLLTFESVRFANWQKWKLNSSNAVKCDRVLIFW